MAGFTMSLNLILLVAMVATNILSLYHLSSTTNFFQSTLKSTQSSVPTVPDHLLRQLHTIRAAINHLTSHQPDKSTSTSSSSPSTTTSRAAAAAPKELLIYSKLSPIASACHNYPDLLHEYMNYTPFSLCPSDTDLVEKLILRGCHPLPRRRCFSRTPRNPSDSKPESNVLWSYYSCKSFDCLITKFPDLGFDLSLEKSKSQFSAYKSELDLPISQLLQIAKSANSVLRLGIDVGGGTGSFAAAMKARNVTVMTTTMNFNAPYSEAVAMRGLVPLHVPLQQRLPVFDGVVDLVRCGRAVNRWIPVTVMEFLFFDLDRILRGGGYLWLDRFFSKKVDLENVYAPMIGKLGYKKVKWAVANKMDSKHGEVFLTALLQKPVAR
ncbi:putative methyltransferase [Cardamine amara subsp. amara]|uniref:Methyltransferase n=1 Tax=Cardamine amara subsp. amara TaxID=228776 RepID=A0ABD1AP90_CARAN